MYRYEFYVDCNWEEIVLLTWYKSNQQIKNALTFDGNFVLYIKYGIYLK